MQILHSSIEPSSYSHSEYEPSWCEWVGSSLSRSFFPKLISIVSASSSFLYLSCPALRPSLALSSIYRKVESSCDTFQRMAYEFLSFLVLQSAFSVSNIWILVLFLRMQQQRQIHMIITTSKRHPPVIPAAKYSPELSGSIAGYIYISISLTTLST